MEKIWKSPSLCKSGEASNYSPSIKYWQESSKDPPRLEVALSLFRHLIHQDPVIRNKEFYYV